MERTGLCPITQKEVPLSDLVNARGIRDNIKELIKKSYPAWDAENGVISEEALNNFRAEYVKNLLEEEKGDLTKLEIVSARKFNLFTNFVYKKFCKLQPFLKAITKLIWKLYELMFQKRSTFSLQVKLTLINLL